MPFFQLSSYLWQQEEEPGNIIVMEGRGRYQPSLEYSHSDWKKSSSNDIYQADRARFDAEKVRGEAGILIEDRYSR